MKKGKVFGKRQIVVSALVVCLAAAVWLNMRFSSLENSNVSENNNSSLGDGQYISNDNLGAAVQTSTGISYISSARVERNNLRTQNLADLRNATEKADAEAKVKNEALATITKLTENSKVEVDIETLIKAKGFDDALCMISDQSVTVIVPKESLTTSETLQIQDAVVSQTDVDLEKIKIITVK